MKIYDAQGRQVTTNEIETLEFYDTGWIACNDWTNQHLGTTLGNDVAHSLSAPLSDLLVKVLISSDGTDANSFELVDAVLNTTVRGITIYAVNDDNIIVQTADNGLGYINSDGAFITLVSSSWYYKIKIWKLG
ncbi:hypothetical protein LCGC14_1150490 [marine sediment metagenome]|uniref:Uncharacterized protein n=1 Tax=marine sediment metagenome TaxID=412755 RepID=A0A0F9LVM0_9ZZZZ